MAFTRRNLLAGGSVTLLAASVSGCGTILHPERKGQVDGKIDPGIAILDGLGLLLFLVPGVIAFAVDFSNGTIYLPGTGSGKRADADTVEEVKFAGKLTEDKLDRIWVDTYGEAKPFAVEDLEQREIADPKDVASLVNGLTVQGFGRA